MRTLWRRGLGLVVVLATLSLATAGAAGAATLNPPIPSNATDVSCSTSPNGTICHYTLTRSGTNLPNWNGVVCDGFTVNYTFSAVGRFTAVYDSAGNEVREVRHVSFSGTLINSTDPSKTVPYEGHWTRTDDLLAHTATFTGVDEHVVLPGQGLVSADIGRLVTELPTFQPESVAGQWEAWPTMSVDSEALCQALA